MKKSLLIAAAVSFIIQLAVVACASLDIVGKASISSFQAVLDAMPEQVQSDGVNGGWSLSAPDGTATFIWSNDYSQSPNDDLIMSFDAEPFLEAGLDASKLNDKVSLANGKITVGAKLGYEKLNYDGEADPLSSFAHIASLHPDALGYHAQLDHYNVSLGNGNMFEWASDMATNAATMETQDKDIVFVLDPQIFIDAGVDPEKVSGWAFAKVQIDVGGKMQEADKLLKPFDIK
ncbi:MAG: hypothetical protein LBU32_19595 [Clostridiales bacterium]|nr:hypothetical protein [Clostridiales bacterium]